jgi:ketosteroid isomerase-like protein
MLQRILVVVLASAVSAGWCSAQKSESGMGGVEETLMQMEKDLSQAFVKGDPAVVERMEAAEFVGTAPDGKVGDKAQDMSDVKTGKMKAESAEPDEMKVHVYGNAAVVTGRMTVKGGQYDGQDISGQYRFTDTWVKNKGKWQVVASQATVLKQ